MSQTSLLRLAIQSSEVNAVVELCQLGFLPELDSIEELWVVAILFLDLFLRPIEHALNYFAIFILFKLGQVLTALL